jgi:hypothetical protein
MPSSLTRYSRRRLGLPWIGTESTRTSDPLPRGQTHRFEMAKPFAQTLRLGIRRKGMGGKKYPDPSARNIYILGGPVDLSPLDDRSRRAEKRRGCILNLEIYPPPWPAPQTEALTIRLAQRRRLWIQRCPMTWTGATLSQTHTIPRSI